MAFKTRQDLDERGFLLVRHVFDIADITRLKDDLDHALTQAGDDARWIRSREGRIYAARNVQAMLPIASEIWQCETLLSLLSETLGGEFGLVRVLYFDKPPERTWSLPWHRDLTISVRRNDLPTSVFSNPTTKAGVPHVEAPQALLESMLTLRIHLDEVTPDNGPLLVIPGSHRAGKAPTNTDAPFETILAEPGDVLAMRPLLSHSSRNSDPQSTSHRRILHFEFAASRVLPDGFEWHYFQPPRDRV